jgi:PAS domain S-box-containing protein
VAERRLSFGLAALASVVLVGALAALDAATGDVTFTSVFLIPPLALSLVASPRAVAWVAVLSLTVAALSALWNDYTAAGHIVRVAIIAFASWLAVLAASARRAAVEARRRMELLAEVGRVADEAPGPEEAVRLLGDVLVPQLADAVSISSGERRLLHRPATDVTRELDLPLVRGGKELGTLSLGWRAQRAGEADEGYARVLAGRVALVVANAELIAELTSTRERLDRTLGALAEAVTVQAPDGQMIYVNDAALRLLGAGSREEVLASAPGELAARFTITREDGAPVERSDLPGWRVLQGDEPEPLLTRSVDNASGRPRWMLTKATAVRDTDGRLLAVNVIEDVTEAKEAERRQRFLAEAGAVLAGSLDHQETLERVARLAVPTLGEWCAVDIVDARGTPRRLALAHADPAKVDLGLEIHRRYPPDLAAESGIGGVLRTGRPELYGEIDDDTLVASAVDEEHLRLLREIGLRSAMLVPMRAAGRTTGVISFVDSRRSFDADDLAFAQDLAQLAATAVENSRLYTERATASETLQRSLLPARLPDLAGWRTASSYVPGAPGVEVGGDFYDIFRVPGAHMVILGDVTGKGVQAAALTSLARYTARTAALFDQRPSAVLHLLNRVLREQTSPAFVTMACARLDPGGLITVSSAGHPLPLRAAASGGVEAVGAHGILLGATDEAGWGEHFTRLSPGDTLLFYTDGVTDTTGEEGRFGEQRLEGLVAAAARDPEQLVGAIVDALDAFQGPDVVDDRAMLALQYTGAPEPHPTGPTLAGGVGPP